MRRLTLLLSLPTLLIAAEPAAREMSVTTPDGYVLSGTLTLPDARGKHPAVILVHQFRADRKGWAPLVEKLNAHGIATLALDLRGHGQSTQQGGASVSITTTYLTASETVGFDQTPTDLTVVAAWLRKQKGIDGRHLGLAGSNEGAFAAMLASSKIKPTVILALSPLGAEAFGQGARDRMVTATTRAHAALMAFVSDGDKEAEDNLAPLRPVYGTNIRTFEESQRGFEYLEQHSDVMAVFFAEYLLHPHTGRGAEKPQQPAEKTSATVLAAPAPGKP
jgi:dienelactone hydrolase